MSLRDWIVESREAVRDQGVIAGCRTAGHELKLGALRRIGRTVPIGTPVYERDWDVLVVMDACRPDLLAEVREEYDFLDRPDTAWSVGSTSRTWMDRNFAPEYEAEMADTVYVSGNPFARDHLPDALGHVEEGWVGDRWDEAAGTVRPAVLTDLAIALGRRHPGKRLVVHYMQPHYPFLGHDLGGGMDRSTFGEGTDAEDDPWQLLARGEIDRETVWTAYRDNLRAVLDSVADLLTNVDGDVVLTADHGNAVGEWGVYGHPAYVPIPALRRVPWYRTTAVDEGGRDPEVEIRGRGPSSTDAVEDRLESLGYA